MTAQLQKIDTETVYQTMLAVQDSYSDHAREFVAFLRAHGHGLTQEGLAAYVASLEEIRPNGRKLAAGSYNIKLAAAKARIRYLFERTPDALDVVKRLQLEQFLNSLKPKKIAKEKRRIGREKMIPYSLIRELSASLQAQRLLPGGHGIALMVEFLAATGTRVSEMLGVTLGDVTAIRGKNQFKVRVLGKGRKERNVKIQEDLHKRIREHFGGTVYFFDHGGGPYTRSYVSNAIKAAGRIYLDREISAHTLRHSFATEKIHKTGKIKAVSEYLGHSSTATTMDMYVHEELTDADLDL